MPPRRKNSVESRLERSNSERDIIIRSMKEDSQRVNPEVARQYALAAANTAYHHSTNYSGSLDEGRNITEIPRPLRKTQSVRFQGPTANTPPRSITRRIAPSWDYVQKRKPKDVANKHSVDGLTALPKYHDASRVSKSSYKKIRKTRSMFSPRKQFGDYFTNASPVREPWQSHLQRHSRLSGSTAIACSNSGVDGTSAEDILMSLPNPYLTSYDQDEAVRLAQYEYRRQIEEQGAIAERPQLRTMNSNISNYQSPNLKSKKSFRLTTRKSSGNKYGASVSSRPVANSMENKGLGHKARKISSSLRSRLKKAFTGKKLDKSLPNQQIDAQRMHFGANSPELNQEEEFPTADIPLPNEELVSRVSSRQSRSLPTPIQHGASRQPHNTQEPGSEPEQDESRVTSWANSTITNATTQSDMINDRKRLTVIEENGDVYQPSTSTNVGQNTVRNKYDAFRRPRPPGRINEPVDSQDIYAALQNKLSEAQVHAKERKSTSNSLASSRKSSFQLHRKGSQISHLNNRLSGRMVSGYSDSVGATRSCSDGSVVVRSKEAVDSDADDVFRPGSAQSSKQKRSGTHSKWGLRSRQSSIESGVDDTPKIRKRNLREVRSSFFPRERHKKSEGLSPYKFPIQESSKRDTRLTSGGHNSQTRIPSPGSMSDDSGSVYSRRTTGTPCGIEARLDPSASNINFGTAATGDSQVNARRYSDLICDGASHNRAPSNASSATDWRSWMASQVAGLEGITEEEGHLSAFNVSKQSLRKPSGSTRLTRSRRCSYSSSPEPLPKPRINKAQSRSIKNTDGQDFDYGFAAANALQKQFSQHDRRVSSTDHQMHSSERSTRSSLPLTERNVSQANVADFDHARKHRQSLPSYRKQSTENKRKYSSHEREPHSFANSIDNTASTHPRVRSSNRTTTNPSSREDYSIDSSRRDPSSRDASISNKTMIVRRSSSERRARLRRTQSSKSVRLHEREDNIDDSQYSFVSRNQIRDEVRYDKSDSPYDTAGSGMLGPSSKASTSRIVNLFLSRKTDDSSDRKASHAFL